MRKASLSLLGMLLLILMVALALFIGAYKGYRQEKEQVESALGSLETVFASRVETGNNLLTVARRHLPEGDELLSSVTRDVQMLTSQAPLPQRAEANLRLEKDGRSLLGALENNPSVQADSRDLGYVTGLLPQALEQSAQWADAGKYNEAAGAFNKRLSGTFSGFLARITGVSEALLFTP